MLSEEGEAKKCTWPPQGVINGVRSVCCANDHDALLSHEGDLVEERAQLRDNAPFVARVLFISRLADRVHLVDEDEHWSAGFLLRVLDRLVEDVAQRLLALAEVCTQNLRSVHERQERVRLCSNRAHKQGLSNTRLACVVER